MARLPVVSFSLRVSCGLRGVSLAVLQDRRVPQMFVGNDGSLRTAIDEGRIDSRWFDLPGVSDNVSVFSWGRRCN